MDYTYEYLEWRGVSKETMALYDIKTKIDFSGKPVSIGFPYSSGECKVRTLSDKSFYTVGSAKAGLFGFDKFTPGVHKYCTITEGELDAASLHQAVGGPVFSIHSSASAARDVGSCRSELNSYERIYLAFDGDAPGKTATAEVARLFDYNKIYVVKFDGRRKDANEYVRNGESEQLKKLWWSSKQYLPETVISSFEDFKEILEEETKPGVPYPFEILNDMTYGIRPGESVLITAQEGVGKTELMHAIEYQLLKETDSNVAAIFLEEPKRRHLQSLAGIHIQKPAHLPDGGCTDAEVYGAIRELVSKDDRLHIYNHFGSDDPDVLLDTIRFLVTTRDCRFVLLDHVSMVVSGLGEKDERLKLDYFTTKLEMMVQELGFGLILVSHVNDEGQTRSSRWISKIAHIRIDLLRDIPSGTNVVEVIVSKNRFSGKTGPAGNYAFNPLTRRYTLHLGDDNARHQDTSSPKYSNDNSPYEIRREVA